jgi:hypothetical protein
MGSRANKECKSSSCLEGGGGAFIENDEVCAVGGRVRRAGEAFSGLFSATDANK